MDEALLILIMTALSCSLLGVLLFLKESVMVADAISHTILLGIVLAFFFVSDLNSPWLVVGATLFGVITVLAIEALTKTKRVQNDAAIGLIFPAFFALAVVLITKFFANVHLDIDIVLMGEIIFAPFNRMDFFGQSLPVSLVYSTGVFVVNLLFVLVTYPILKIRLFDETFAKTIGIAVTLLDIALMTLVSLTCVVSFQSIGAILVIALMIAPVMTASLLSHQLSHILIISGLIAALNACIGYYLANYLNVSIAGMVAATSFILFLLVFILNEHFHTPTIKKPSQL